MLDSETRITPDAGEGGRANRGEEEPQMARKSYQEGSVYATSNGKWWKGRYRVWEVGPDGKRKRVQKNVTLGPLRGTDRITKAQAKSRLARKVQSVNEGWHKPESTMTLERFVEEYSVFDNVRRSTLQPYLSEYSRHLRPFFGPMKLCEIESAHVQTFLNEKAKALSKKTLVELRNLLSGILRQPYEWGWLERNAARQVRVPQGVPSRRRPPIALTVGQARSLIAVLEEPFHTMLELVLMTGFSRSELLALRWDRVDFDKKLIEVAEGFVNGRFGKPKTPNRVRIVPLEEPSLSRLRWLGESAGWPGGEALVFPNYKGKPYDPNGISRRVIKPACEKAKVPSVAWHDLRHTHGTLIAPLLPDYLVRQQLGHSGSGVTFRVYVHDAVDIRREAVRRLAALLFPNVPPAKRTGEVTEEQNEGGVAASVSTAVN